ncbi:MAG: cysteine hydrolase [Gammaproteobacteria bacterium]|nr:cysteine hydrolase [Gammaproteobacteria bacterium]
MKKSALIVIDFINDIVHANSQMGTIVDFVAQYKVIDRANDAMNFARAHHIPVVLVKVGFSSGYPECPEHSPVFANAKKFEKLQLNTWGTEFHEALQYQESDLVIVKHRVSPLYATGLETFLRANQIDTLFIAGVATDMAVQTLAREAHDRDYQVNIIADACGAHTLEIHQFTLKCLERLATIVNVSDLNRGMLE